MVLSVTFDWSIFCKEATHFLDSGSTPIKRCFAGNVTHCFLKHLIYMSKQIRGKLLKYCFQNYVFITVIYTSITASKYEIWDFK